MGNLSINCSKLSNSLFWCLKDPKSDSDSDLCETAKICCKIFLSITFSAIAGGAVMAIFLIPSLFSILTTTGVVAIGITTAVGVQTYLTYHFISYKRAPKDPTTPKEVKVVATRKKVDPPPPIVIPAGTPGTTPKILEREVTWTEYSPILHTYTPEGLPHRVRRLYI